MSFEAWGDPPETIYDESDKWRSFDCLENEHADCDDIAINGNECGCTCHEVAEDVDEDMLRGVQAINHKYKVLKTMEVELELPG